MEFNIKSKFEIKGNVWFMYENRIMHGTVNAIFYEGYYNTCIYPQDNCQIKYNVEVWIDCDRYDISVDETELFATKESLMNYLDSNVNKMK